MKTYEFTVNELGQTNIIYYIDDFMETIEGYKDDKEIVFSEVRQGYKLKEL